MTSDQYLGKYIRLEEKAFKDVITSLDKKLPIINEDSNHYITTNAGTGNLQITGISKDSEGYFLITDMWNVRINNDMELTNLIAILAFIEEYEDTSK